jgi:hypothetical protein
MLLPNVCPLPYTLSSIPIFVVRQTDHVSGPGYTHILGVASYSSDQGNTSVKESMWRVATSQHSIACSYIVWGQ